MGELNIWVVEGMMLGRGTTLAGKARAAGDGECCNFSLKIAAKSARDAMASFPTLAKGASGCGFWKASGRWMITVAFDNCGEIIREYPRCGRWPLSRCIHFDTGNDAWRDQVNIHADREDPKLAACLLSCGR
jgi:hypothetical protein